MPLPPIPITKPWFGPEEEQAVAEVLRSGWIMQGPRVEAFERAFAAYVGAPHAVAVSSGTAALHLALMASGVGSGDEVICPSLSFIATANAIVHAGARPRFAEVEERSYNLSVGAVAAQIGPRTKAILAVHQVGSPSDLAELGAVAARDGLLLVEDAACAIGSTYEGARIGRPHGRAACFSFHPRKILTTGEGGMVTTDDADLAARVRALRQHGQTEKGFEFGYNLRMTDLQAAVGLVQLGRLDEMVARRRAQAARYDLALEGIAHLERPHVSSDRVANYQSYVIRLRGKGRAGRDALIETLSRYGISTRPGIMASHREPAYAAMGVQLPLTEQLADETLALPLYHEMTEQAQDRVVSALRKELG